MRKTLLVIALVFFALFAYPHKRALFNIIIDTDGGQDDFRAISLFCASADFNINAITSVDGVLFSNETANYVHELMQTYGHEGIPIGVGKDRKYKKTYRNHAIKAWQNLFPNISEKQLPDAQEVLLEALSNERRPTIIVALGPLGNIAELLREHPDIRKKIGQVIWYNSDANLKSGYNLDVDIEAFKFLDAMHIPLKIVSTPIKQTYSVEFWEILKEIEHSIYADSFIKFHEVFDNNEIQFWDDLTALYLCNLNFFSESFNTMGLPVLQPIQPFYPDILVSALLNVNKTGEGVIFNEIPVSDHWIMLDIRDYVDSVVAKHGKAEFKIVAFASEFHSHLGGYSIVGAKMGLRAMEYFHAGLDEIFVTSYAGYRPPLSCMNDGLQFGTGATIGYGSIKVKTDDLQAKARITYNKR
ncbi:MAG: hypothetical protein GX879_03935, partial [Bacteroidales bacterium]|nr:hypothetical protein [Bacteroidales bacterium]